MSRRTPMGKSTSYNILSHDETPVQTPRLPPRPKTGVAALLYSDVENKANLPAEIAQHPIKSELHPSRESLGHSTRRSRNQVDTLSLLDLADGTSSKRIKVSEEQDKRCVALEEERTTLKTEIQLLGKDCEEAKLKVQKQELAIVDYKNKLCQAEASLKTLTQENKGLEGENTKLAREIDALKLNIQTIEKSKKKSEHDLRVAQDAQSQLKEKLVACEEEFHSYKLESNLRINKLESEMAQLKEENDKIQRDLQNTQMSEASAQSARMMAEQEASAMRVDLQRTREEYSQGMHLLKKTKAARDRRSIAFHQIMKIKEEVDTANRDLSTDLRTHDQDSNQKITILEKSLSQMTKANNQLEIDLKETNDECLRLAIELEKKLSENKDAQAHLKISQEKVDFLLKELQTKEKVCELLEQKLEMSTNENTSLNDKLYKEYLEQREAKNFAAQLEKETEVMVKMLKQKTELANNLAHTEQLIRTSTEQCLNQEQSLSKEIKTALQKVTQDQMELEDDYAFEKDSRHRAEQRLLHEHRLRKDLEARLQEEMQEHHESVNTVNQLQQQLLSVLESTKQSQLSSEQEKHRLTKEVEALSATLTAELAQLQKKTDDFNLLTSRADLLESQKTEADRRALRSEQLMRASEYHLQEIEKKVLEEQERANCLETISSKQIADLEGKLKKEAQGRLLAEQQSAIH